MSTSIFDPLDPTFVADPYPGYAWLRDHDPVHHHPADHRAPAFWALSRFEHVWDAVRCPEVFSSASGLTFFRDEISQLGLPPTIVMLDPPVQTRLLSFRKLGIAAASSIDVLSTNAIPHTGHCPRASCSIPS